MELLIGLVVLGILASLALVSLQGYRDRTAMMVDEANQKVLQAAVMLYAYDKNALPASLSRLRPQDLQRAYALVIEGKKPYTLLAYLTDCIQGRTAHAETVLPPAYYHNEVRVLVCPADQFPPTAVDDSKHRSYGIHPGAAGKPLNWLLDPANAAAILIWETRDDGVTPEARHNGRRENVITRVEGGSGRSEEGRSEEGDGGEEDGDGEDGEGEDRNREYNDEDDEDIQNAPPAERRNRFHNRVHSFLRNDFEHRRMRETQRHAFMVWVFEQFNNLPDRTARMQFMQRQHLRELLDQFLGDSSTRS